MRQHVGLLVVEHIDRPITMSTNTEPYACPRRSAKSSTPTTGTVSICGSGKA
jgi:hypothetical protein